MEKLPTCCGLVSDTANWHVKIVRSAAQVRNELATRFTATCCQLVADLSGTSVMEFGKRHDTTDTTDFCPSQLVTDLLRICYGENGVMDFGLSPVIMQVIFCVLTASGGMQTGSSYTRWGRKTCESSASLVYAGNSWTRIATRAGGQLSAAPNKNNCS